MQVFLGLGGSPFAPVGGITATQQRRAELTFGRSNRTALPSTAARRRGYLGPEAGASAHRTAPTSFRSPRPSSRSPRAGPSTPTQTAPRAIPSPPSVASFASRE